MSTPRELEPKKKAARLTNCVFKSNKGQLSDLSHGQEQISAKSDMHIYIQDKVSVPHHDLGLWRPHIYSRATYYYSRDHMQQHGGYMHVNTLLRI